MTDDLPPPGAAVDNQRGDGARTERDSVAPRSLFPQHPAADRCKGRLAFLLVLVCYAIIDYGRLQWVPLGPDTGHSWHVFYASYVEWFYHNDLAHWFPYGVYGQPNLIYNLMNLTATDYLMMAVGKILRISNALVLFQLSLMAKHVIFLFGVLLLSRTLFRRPSTVWLCLIGSIAFLHAFQLNQRQIICMVGWYPLVACFLVRFFRDHQPEGLWLAGTWFAFSCLGNAYEQPWPLMALVPFMAVATWKHHEAWRQIFRFKAGNLAAMISFASVASLYLYLALNVLDGVETARHGKIGVGGLVDLATFSADKTRIYTLYELALSFVDGHAFYIGFLPLGCVLWGLVRVRTALFWTFVSSALFFVWFALGGVLAVALYYSVPFVKLLHYIYMGFHFLPLIFLLAAGAAWDELEISRNNLKPWLAFPLVILLAIDFSFYGFNLDLTPENLQRLLRVLWAAVGKIGLYAGLLALAAILGRCSRPAATQGLRGQWPGRMSFHSLATIALLLGLFVDVFGYSYRSGLPGNGIGNGFDAPGNNWSPVKQSSPVYRACYVGPLTWQGERLEQPVSERKRVALQTPAYVYTYAFAQFDPCESEIDWRTVGGTVGVAIHKLLSLRDKDDPALKTLLGCHAPKLRLMTQALYVNNEPEAAAAVRSHGDLTNVAILEVPLNSPRPSTPKSPPAGSPGSFQVTDFGANAIEINVNVTVPEGAWLVYADTYDPRWRAWLNGKPAPVVPAYVGLKAVWVPHGESVVRMQFSAWSNVGLRALAVGGALCSLSLLLYCGVCCVRGFPTSRRKVSGTLPRPSDEPAEPVLRDPEKKSS